MEYIKIRFGKNLGHMHSRLQRTIDEMFRQVNPMLVLPEQAWRPQMDMYETPKEIMIVAEISGVDREDLVVELDEKAVRITGVRRETARMQGIRYHLAGRSGSEKEEAGHCIHVRSGSLWWLLYCLWW